MQFFEKLKSTSQQLTKKEYWQLIIEKIIEQIGAKKRANIDNVISLSNLQRKSQMIKLRSSHWILRVEGN